MLNETRLHGHSLNTINMNRVENSIEKKGQNGIKLSIWVDETCSGANNVHDPSLLFSRSLFLDLRLYGVEVVAVVTFHDDFVARFHNTILHCVDHIVQTVLQSAQRTKESESAS